MFLIVRLTNQQLNCNFIIESEKELEAARAVEEESAAERLSGRLAYLYFSWYCKDLIINLLLFFNMIRETLI